ncbi:hypothetical protein Pelo_9693 [Pelomyxa schiedti]|nr:hypothetical protein Pelo_9693 [Pelomyxa schiedti]
MVMKVTVKDCTEEGKTDIHVVAFSSYTVAKVIAKRSPAGGWPPRGRLSLPDKWIHFGPFMTPSWGGCTAKSSAWQAIAPSIPSAKTHTGDTVFETLCTGLIVDHVPNLRDTLWQYTSGPGWLCTKQFKPSFTWRFLTITSSTMILPTRTLEHIPVLTNKPIKQIVTHRTRCTFALLIKPVFLILLLPEKFTFQERLSSRKMQGPEVVEYRMSIPEFIPHRLGVWTVSCLMEVECKADVALPSAEVRRRVIAAFAAVCARHPFLRALFGPPSDRYLKIPPSIADDELPLSFRDLESSSEAQQILKAHADEDWVSQRTWKCVASTCRDSKAIFLNLLISHSIADGVSLAHLCRDILQALNGEILAPLPIPQPHECRHVGSTFLEPENWDAFAATYMPIIDRNRTLVKNVKSSFKFSVAETTAIVNACKLNSTTVTCLFMAAETLALGCPPAVSACTPVNLHAPDDMGLSFTVSHIIVPPFQPATPTSSTPEAQTACLWELSRQWHTAMKLAHMAQSVPGGPLHKHTSDLFLSPDYTPMVDLHPKSLNIMISSIGDFGANFGIDEAGAKPSALFRVSGFAVHGGKEYTPRDPIMWCGTLAGSLQFAIMVFTHLQEIADTLAQSIRKLLLSCVY